MEEPTVGIEKVPPRIAASAREHLREGLMAAEFGLDSLNEIAVRRISERPCPPATQEGVHRFFFASFARNDHA
jgi:hypothetical protein